MMALANGAESMHGTKRKRVPQTSHDATIRKPAITSTATKSDERPRKSEQALPIAAHEKRIIESLSKSPVMVLSGETGSGKSTQLPQFLLRSQPSARIAITQPRRMAAISLARRVAQELRTPLGKSSPAAKVGYSVRFDDNVGRGNRIKYLTEGMLLQELLRDPGLSEYDYVVVDEVHERSVNVDLILGFLRDLVSGNGVGAKKRGGKRLRVVVMSATADVEKLETFFNEGLSAATNHDTQSTVGTFPSAREEKTVAKKANGHTNGGLMNKVSTCFIEGRQYPVETIYLPQPTQDYPDAAFKCIFQIHAKEPMPGDILVFLTGQDVIQALQKLVEDYAQRLGPEYPKLLVLPLFAALPQAAQQQVFDPPPRNTRKVILATNIAETSITVSGVRFVIDCGKAKLKQFRTRLGLDSLLSKPISQSSAIQRTGRAGREAPGKCWRLYTEQSYEELDKENTPEILRTDLASAVLTMKANGVDDVINFPLLTPPSRDRMDSALLSLLNLDALNEHDGSISDVGRKMSRLPLSPALGRVLIAAADADMHVLLPAIDIVACLSVENIFLSDDTEEGREQARTARQSLFRRQGDHLTLLAAVQGYAAENTDRKEWARKHLISHRAMQSVMDVRKQLRAQCQQQRLLPTGTDAAQANDSNVVSEEDAEKILRCFLLGFKSNTARLMPDGSYKTFTGNQTAAIHPSSVLWGRKVEAILFNEFVYTNRSYARGVSTVQLKWIDEVWS